MRRFIIILFFAALIGSRFMVAPGVSWGDFFCVPLLIYVLFNLKGLSFKDNSIAKISFIYSVILLLSGIINATITNTVYLNFTRIFIEGLVTFAALTIALRGYKEILFFVISFVVYTVIFLMYFRTSLESTAELYDNFQLLDIQGGRNGMAVTNLLIIIMLSFIALYTNIPKRKLVLIFLPFLIFSIIFSASRYSVISLGIFGVAIIYLMRGKLSMRGVLISLVAVFATIYLVDLLMSGVSIGVMDYSSELLNNKLTKNEDGGFSYRINDLNIQVISQWLQSHPPYMYLFGDGISITHGVFSFTFCCTGIVGFVYFVIGHIKMIINFWRRTRIGQFMAVTIFLFFLNDVVTNSRFIIGVNNLLYMGIMAFAYCYERVTKNNLC